MVQLLVSISLEPVIIPRTATATLAAPLLLVLFLPPPQAVPGAKLCVRVCHLAYLWFCGCAVDVAV